jgi:NAD+ diphosphatase
MLVTPSGFMPRLDDADAPEDGWWFVVQQGKLLVLRGDTPRLPAPGSLPVDTAQLASSAIFGDYDGRACRVLLLEPGTLPDAPDGDYEWRGLRSLFGVLPDAEVALGGRAMQLAEWTRTHRHCGACGAPMRRQPGERAMQCPACGFTAYPRIAPAMMVLVRRGERILLARAANFAPGVYSALAGFVEAGESLEECVHREVREEVGIEVTNLRYFRSQSWPFPHSLMLAFVADHASGELAPNPAELVDARWFAPDDLPQLPGRFSISRALIDSVLDDLRRGPGR